MPELVQVNVDTRGFDKLEKAFSRAGREVKPALRRAINWTGGKVTTATVRALVKQTGMKYGAVKKQITQKRASGGNLVYRIIARGTATSLKEFAPRQVRKGVSARPWNKRRIFPHAFIAPSMGGHVFVRTSSKRFPLKKLFGPIVPHELVKDASRSAFEATVERELPPRIAHEIEAILDGHAPS